jgi:hypothetical protein
VTERQPVSGRPRIGAHRVDMLVHDLLDTRAERAHPPDGELPDHRPAADSPSRWT